MRTNIVIDDQLLEEAFSVSRCKTKKEVIHEALRELIRLRKRKDLTDLAGRISFYPGYSHKTFKENQMILVDTSVWIEILKTRRSKARETFLDIVADEPYGLCRFTQLELLQGAKEEQEWRLLDEYLADQYYLEVKEDTWRKAARIFFELRRKGITVNSPIDCCIAQIALDEKALLLHRDRDFEKIAHLRPLSTLWFMENH